jgi:hypothetical protein
MVTPRAFVERALPRGAKKRRGTIRRGARKPLVFRVEVNHHARYSHVRRRRRSYRERRRRPRLIEPTDALVAVAHACICGSDLWPYRTLEHTDVGRRMGHEAIGVVEAVGADVRTMKVGDIVVIPYLLVSTLPDRVFLSFGELAAYSLLGHETRRGANLWRFVKRRHDTGASEGHQSVHRGVERS